jgi:hypothetical protein
MVYLETVKKHSSSTLPTSSDVAMKPLSTETDYRDQSHFPKTPTFTRQKFGDYFQQEAPKSEDVQSQSTGFKMAGADVNTHSYLRETASSVSSLLLRRNSLLIFDDLFANHVSKVTFMIRGMLNGWSLGG